ncbi:HNH endonuclease [Helicobacter cetorum]|uniref:HNH endonuclease n=1 Tax=Helicobacter cetorum TaxID=138563 RepID=UPI0013159AEA|nr:HNH endonuclease [Helicobacter cetorum]
MKINLDSFFDFFDIFLISNPFVSINKEVCVTQELKNKFGKFFNKYKQEFKGLNKLKAMFECLQFGDIFYICNYDDMKMIAEITLSFCNQVVCRFPNYFKKTDNRNNESLIQKLMTLPNNYSVNPYVQDKKTTIGEPNKTKRVCRFCNKDFRETSFNNKAHVIPESLGNKILFSSNECDTCNKRFGETIDYSLSKFFELEYLVRGIRGKKVRKKALYDNGSEVYPKEGLESWLESIDDEKYKENIREYLRQFDLFLERLNQSFVQGKSLFYKQKFIKELLDKEKLDNLMNSKDADERMRVVCKNILENRDKLETLFSFSGVFLKGSDFSIKEVNGVKYHVLSSKECIGIDVYKALCKMVISVIDSKELPFLQKCVEWINHKVLEETKIFASHSSRGF